MSKVCLSSSRSRFIFLSLPSTRLTTKAETFKLKQAIMYADEEHCYEYGEEDSDSSLAAIHQAIATKHTSATPELIRSPLSTSPQPSAPRPSRLPQRTGAARASMALPPASKRTSLDIDGMHGSPSRIPALKSAPGSPGGTRGRASGAVSPSGPTSNPAAAPATSARASSPMQRRAFGDSTGRQ